MLDVCSDPHVQNVSRLPCAEFAVILMRNPRCLWMITRSSISSTLGSVYSRTERYAGRHLGKWLIADQCALQGYKAKSKAQGFDKFTLDKKEIRRVIRIFWKLPAEEEVQGESA